MLTVRIKTKEALDCDPDISYNKNDDSYSSHKHRDEDRSDFKKYMGEIIYVSETRQIHSHLKSYRCDFDNIPEWVIEEIIQEI